MFLSLLGNVAGNLALTLGARGGVYVGGGIVARLAARIDASRFRQRFEQKGRFATYLSRIPVLLIQPGGIRRCAERRARWTAEIPSVRPGAGSSTTPSATWLKPQST